MSNTNSASSGQNYELSDEDPVYKKKRCILYPENRTKFYWDSYVAILLVITCLQIPYNLAFEKSSKHSTYLLAYNLYIDATFFIDILVQFNSAYYIS